MSIIHAITTDEFIPIVALIALLSCVGRQMTSPDEHQWSRRLAAAGFIGYAILACGELPLHTAWDFVKLTIRSILAAGLVLSVSYILLPAMSFVFRHTVAGLIPKRRPPRVTSPVSRPVVSLPPPAATPSQPERTEETTAALYERYAERCRQIDAGPFDPQTKIALKNNEEEKLRDKLENLLR